MHAKALVLCMALLSTGCASVSFTPRRSGSLRDNMPRGASGPSLMQSPQEERPLTWQTAASSIAGDALLRRLVRRRGPQGGVTGAASGGLAGGAAASASGVDDAVLEAVGGVTDSTDSIASALSKLASRPPTILGSRGLSGMGGGFTRYLEFGSNQLSWLRGALRGTTAMVAVAKEMGDADMELGILRMTGPRLQSAMFGSMLLAAWADFLTLADVVLRECSTCGAETLLVDMNRVQQRIVPTLEALASGDEERVEDAATAMPELMGQLTREFASIRDRSRKSMENGENLMTAMQLVDMVAMISAMKMSLPRLPPAAPATLGVSLVMTSGGVMAGSQLAVSAEWVEMIRRLVQAGVISIPAVSAAVRIHGGHVMMASGELPERLREALGDSPEVRGMQVTGKAGAGMSENPLHHVMPQERRTWFVERGFQGDMDIDNFCVRLEKAHHEAIHGGGDWRLGRLWPGEWNRMIMEALADAETAIGRRLTRNETLEIVADRMRRYDIAVKFSRWRGR